MILGIILGFVIGTPLLVALYRWSQKNDFESEDVVLDDDVSIENKPFLLDLPLEKKLQNALFECERNLTKCREEISDIIVQQLDLIDEICKPTYVHLRDKPIYFVIDNPVTKEKKYYYSRDINLEIDHSLVTETQKLLLTYEEHIEILKSKISLFEKLKKSHLENLNKIQGIFNQHKQSLKISKHKNKIEELDGKIDMEVNALKNEAVLEDIERELEFQNQCMEQLNELNDKYNFKEDNTQKNNLKDRLKKLEEKIDHENGQND
jgi:hypothetical protein